MNRRDFIKTALIGAAGGALASVLPTYAASKQGPGSVSFAGPSPKTRYVSKDGNDTADGKAWRTAKLTVRNAVESLPEEDILGSARKSGDVFIGEGEFIEDDIGVDPSQNYLIECSSNIRFHGRGMPVSNLMRPGQSVGGTVIKLADNVNRHLFAPRTGFSGFAHAVIFSDMLLDGNRNNNQGAFDIVRLQRPGFNTSMRDCQFRNAPRNAIYVQDSTVNFYMFNLTGANNGRFLHFDVAPDASNYNFGIIGLQIDNCGDHPILITARQGGAGNFFLNGLESEANTADQHKSIIKYNPVQGNAMNITLSNIVAQKASNLTQPEDAVILVESGSGPSPELIYTNVINQGYPNVFNDKNLDLKSSHRKFANFGPSLWENIQIASVEIHTAPVGPEGQIKAKAGSICMTTGTSGSLFVKTSGDKDSKTGWKKVLTEKP